METVFGKLLLGVAAVALGLAIGVGVLAVRVSRNSRNWPDDGRKRELIAQIQAWKREGLGYRERLGLLSAQGLRRDVADALLGEAERTQNSP